MQNDVLRFPNQWWFWALFALIAGFRTAQDNVRKLDNVSGWGLVGTWALVAAGLLLLVFNSWVALAKFRTRDMPTASN